MPFNTASDPANYLDLPLRPRLLPGSFHLGADEAPIEYEAVSIRIGRSPLVYNLKKTWEQNGAELPEQYRGLYLYHNIFLLKHHVHIVDRSWVDQVIRFGYEVLFPKDVTIIDLFPQTAYQKQQAGYWKAEAAAGLNGRFQRTGDSPAAGAAPAVAPLSIDVVTPEIIAVGEGDYRGEWVYNRGARSLAGTHQMTQTLLVFDTAQELEFKARVYATFLTAEMLPDKRVSEWVDLHCTLPV